MRVQLKGCVARSQKIGGWGSARLLVRLERRPSSGGSSRRSRIIASYNTAVASRKRPSNKDLSSLLDAYQDSKAYCCLSPKSKKDYSRILASICEKFGDRPIGLLDDRRVRGDFLAWRDEIAKSSPAKRTTLLPYLAVRFRGHWIVG